MVSPDGESVLASIDFTAWSPEDGVAFEVAVEGINQLVGVYSGLIGREQVSESPDAAAIESWRAARREWAATRATLTPTDRAEVDRVRTACSALLRELRSQRGA